MNLVSSDVGILCRDSTPTSRRNAILSRSLLSTQSVQHLSFSTDERFLLGCGGENLVYVWDTKTGELVVGKRYTEPATLGQWTSVKQAGRRNVYHVRLVLLPRAGVER